MKKIELNRTSKVYVLCPAYSKTGGPELLHQLVKKMNDFNIDANIVYFRTNKDNKAYRNSEFDIYTQTYIELDGIEDKEENLLIIPEISTAIKLSKKFKNIKKAIWWLSVDNFLKGYRIFKPIETTGVYTYIKSLIKGRILFNFNYIKNIEYHLCQSYYAIDFLKSKGIEEPLYLSDYINNTFLEDNIKKIEKQDIVLYNPKKGFEFTNKIINLSPDFKWVPIKNLTTQQVKELLLKSKVYIDFGNHPGKDRFPREAAMCGCCIITGKRGSAAFDKDVPIGEEFKFDDKSQNIPVIVQKIKQCFENYEIENRKFDKYRQYIKSEEKAFEEDIKRIFCI